MEKVLLLYKPIGETPLECIRKFQKTNAKYEHQTLGYAGRLDPMAEGLLLVLAGEENKNRKIYEQYPKNYTFSILPGFVTDTYDVMGKILATPRVPLETLDAHVLSSLARAQIGTFEQPYPLYSSAVVERKPLYYWARHGGLAERQIPRKSVTISTCRYVSTVKVEKSQLLMTLTNRLKTVSGNFRQLEILAQWEKSLDHVGSMIPVYTFDLTCTSGTYVRSLAHRIGQTMKTGAIAYTIIRTMVGPYSLEKAYRFD